MISWPATLPQEVMKYSYRSGSGDGRARTETDSGVAKVRRRFSAIPRPLQVSIRLTVDQLVVFKSFVNVDLSGGVLPFLFPNQEESGLIWTVQFGQNMPSWSKNHDDEDWIVTLDLVILP